MELKKAFGGRKSIDMTQGKVATQLISFAIPLIMGNLVQQLYNTVDAWVVGNFVSNEAFAAVGTVGAITNLIVMSTTLIMLLKGKNPEYIITTGTASGYNCLMLLCKKERTHIKYEFNL